MSRLQKALFLSDKGYADLKKAIFACTLTNLAMLLPFCVTVMIFSEILTPFVNGGSIQWNHIWMLWGAGIVSAILVFLAAKNDYRKTYIASYKESNTTRLRIAEHLRKLPMNFFNTKDLSELTTNMMADCSSMSFVFQDVTLFNDTVMNNIRLGNPNATDDQVIAAAKAAYCDEFVREMPDGYQTVLGENGSTLSGGERQRISIARALLKNAPIILLDEATASLDPENEVLVQKAIAKLVEGKTVIMIAHRLRTVVDADQILVLDNGRLAEYGTHDELMKKNGLYHKLFHIQQESLGWAV